MNPTQIAAILGLMLLSLSGCKYERSFMNMDSNSGSPFFGLQLAVDSGSRPPVIGESPRDGDQPALSGRRAFAVPDLGESAAKVLSRNNFCTTDILVRRNCRDGQGCPSYKSGNYFGTIPKSYPPILFTRSPATRPNGFERTSDARELKTDVRYSLQAPTTDRSLQTQAIDLRLSAF